MPQVDIPLMESVAQRLLLIVPPDTPAPQAEFACLWAYCAIAGGVRRFPAHTRAPRALLVLKRGADALVKAIEAVSMLTDEQVEAELAQPDAGSTVQ